MKISSDELINEVKNVIQWLREVERMVTNLGTVIEYENPIEYKHYFAYSFG